MLQFQSANVSLQYTQLVKNLFSIEHLFAICLQVSLLLIPERLAVRVNLGITKQTAAAVFSVQPWRGRGECNFDINFPLDGFERRRQDV